MAVPFIDLKSQYKALKSDIDARIAKVLEHQAFINGPEITELEKKLAQFVGVDYALACASGTDALLIPMMALGIGSGDEVITSAFSFIATAETIYLAGATPVYADIDPRTYNLDLKHVEKLITKKTKAILPVSLYGQMPDMKALESLCQKHGLHLIEDAAQSFGARFEGRRSCSYGIAGGTSFFPAKPLGCYGDGGAIFTKDAHLYKIMKEVREHGSERRYYHTRLGVNGRLDTLQCAVLLAKMERYNWELEKRNWVAAEYNKAFASLADRGIQIPFVSSNAVSAWAQYTLRVEKRSAFIDHLTALGIPTSIHYPMIMPDQPWYKEQPQGPRQDWTESRRAAEHVVSLPMFPDMTPSQLDEVISAVKGFKA